MIKVLSFDKQVHDLSKLSEMTDSEKVELVKMGMMLGDDDVYICSLEEFQNFYNTEMASSEHSYIFFVESENL